MCRIVLIVVVVVLILLMVGAAIVVQAYGWTGFLVFLAGLVILGYAIRKATPHLIMYIVTRPLKQMGAPLRGATTIVHSVTACEPPPPEEYNPGYDLSEDEHSDEAIEDADAEEDESDENYDDAEDEADEIPPDGLDWYWVEFTVTPPDAGSKEGGIVNRKAWVPQFVGATGPRPELRRSDPFRGWPLPDEFTDNVHHTAAQVWDGAEFATSEREIFGEHRIRLRIGVTREVSRVTITYVQYTDIGEVQIPRINVLPDQSP